MRTSAWMLAGAAALVTVPGFAADVEDQSADQRSWARWQGRLSLGSAAPAWRLGVEAPARRFGSATLMGDYYFGRPLADVGRLGGFRATSGLVIGARGALSTGQPGLGAGSAFSIGSRAVAAPSAPYGSAETAGDSATLPYLGLGYTGLSARHRWSFSADLGLIGQSSGSALRFGRAFIGGQSLDDAVREMRLAPLLQLGVSYAF